MPKRSRKACLRDLPPKETPSDMIGYKVVARYSDSGLVGHTPRLPLRKNYYFWYIWAILNFYLRLWVFGEDGNCENVVHCYFFDQDGLTPYLKFVVRMSY